MAMQYLGLLWEGLMVGLLLAGYECLWAKIIERISGELLPMLMAVVQVGITPDDIEQAIFGGPGKIMQSMIGGENACSLAPFASNLRRA